MTKTAIEMITEARALVGIVTAAEAADELAAGTAVVIDVRQADEWDHGHIDGSVHTPRGLLEFIADPTSPRHKDELDPSRRTIVVCASGARAALAAATITSMGYEDVAVLDGGLKAWIDAGLPTTEHEYAGI
jgi:rhodanese-related sulfurtransferase